MKILHVTPSYYPATYWGGPIWSVKAICDGIAARPDMTVHVLTTDAAGPQVRERVQAADLPYPVDYCRRWAGHSMAPGLLARLPGAIGWADLVHLTGAYSMPTLPTLALAKLMGKPVVWSPRGALMATAGWADAPRLRLKRGVEHLAQWLRPARTTLHVTAPVEGAMSIARLPGIAQAVIPNAVEIPKLPPRTPRKAGATRLMYLGRIHPKKGLPLLLQALQALPASFTLDIYGTGAPAHVAEVAQAARPLGNRVRLHGHVEGAEKAAAFADADLFVLPSYSENFAIVVAEALAHGLPVLTTTGTPWRDVARHGCGRCIDLDRADLAAEIAAMADADLRAMGARGRDWMARDYAPAAMVAAFASLYSEMRAPAGQAVPA